MYIKTQSHGGGKQNNMRKRVFAQISLEGIEPIRTCVFVFCFDKLIK